MKSKLIRYVIPLLVVAGAQPLLAQPEKPAIQKLERRAPGAPHRDSSRVFRIDGEKEKVTFLGVETAPVSRTVAAQLGLDPDFGLVVGHILKDTPAAGVLEEHDILLKLEDQLLIDARQFSVLIRAKKPGDQVTLTVLRGGKERKVSVKLGEREMPKLSGLRGPDFGELRFFGRDGPGIAPLRELPGLGREELGDVFRMLGNEKGNWIKSPRVHVLRRGQGSTILNLNEGNFVFSDDEGSVEVKAGDGKRELTVKDANGKVTYQGSISSDAERDKLPPEVKERLRVIEGIDIDERVGEGFEQEGAAIGQPARAKISVRRL